MMVDIMTTQSNTVMTGMKLSNLAYCLHLRRVNLHFSWTHDEQEYGDAVHDLAAKAECVWDKR